MTDFGFCSIPAVALRAGASHRSEMVSQLLFGETYRILQSEGEWLEVETDFDGYRGFIAANQHKALDEKNYREWKDTPAEATQDFLRICDLQERTSFWCPPAATLPSNDSRFIHIGSYRFEAEKLPAHRNLTDILKLYEGAPYLWGGRTPWGTDCSGFTQAVFKTQGISLPRDASQQIRLGEEISLQESGFGDLAFFQNTEGQITHVGFVFDSGLILHCSGHVRLDLLDEHGIVRLDDHVQTHQLHSIKHITHFK